MPRGKATSSCAAALLLCTVLVLPAATGEKGKVEACALQCIRVVSRMKTEAKCKLLSATHNVNCSLQQLLDKLQDVSSL